MTTEILLRCSDVASCLGQSLPDKRGQKTKIEGILHVPGSHRLYYELKILCFIDAFTQLPHLNPRLPLLFCSPFIISPFSFSTCVVLALFLSFSFPLYSLSAHCFHVTLLSFSIFACLAHFSATVNWILYFSTAPLSLYLLDLFLCVTPSYFHLPLSW